MRKPHILGLSASLRNARSKSGSANLTAEVAAIASRADLDTYMDEQARIHLDQFVEAGRAEGRPFDEIYRALQRTGGLKGLSNSEVCLVAAMWAAREKGCSVEHVALADHFPADGSAVDIDALKAKLRASDGFLLSTPVYFGDRSSIAHKFIDMIRADSALQADLAGKLYAGLAVGAKRNGGQETTLIYQMLDLVNLGLLGVGNDSDTTSQYGGTAHAGDIGTIPKDEYGINTSLGTGRRIGRVAAEMSIGKDSRLADPLRLGIWILQDRSGEMAERAAPFLRELQDVDLRAISLTGYRVRPCLACDICPIHVGPDAEYRCIIARREDGMKQLHEDLLWPDVLVPALYSPRDRTGLESVYQQFMERTRYLRRGDYVYTDRLVVPMVFEEVGANENLDIRVMTSFIRHHTVMAKPVVGLIHNGVLINAEDVRRDLAAAMAQGRRLVQGRLAAASMGAKATQYNPVGYVLSAAKDKEMSTLGARELATQARNEKTVAQARERLETVEPTSRAAGE
jgi:multimeric flavodoxin WrbA